MCLICASQPTPPDAATAAALHAVPPAQQITPVYISGEMSFGTDLPAADLAALASQLTDGYWQGTGRSARSFDVDPGDTLVVDLSGLTAAGATLARQALDAWSEVSGITFDDTPATGTPAYSGATSSSRYKTTMFFCCIAFCSSSFSCILCPSPGAALPVGAAFSFSHSLRKARRTAATSPVFYPSAGPAGHTPAERPILASSHSFSSFSSL